MPSPSGGGASAYIQIYSDAACNNLFQTVKAIHIEGTITGTSHFMTIGEKSYEYYDFNSGNRIDVSMFGFNPPFLTSRNRVPNLTQMYMKNNVQFSFQEATARIEVAHFMVGDRQIFIGSNQGATEENPARCYAITFLKDGKQFIGFTSCFSEFSFYTLPICCVEKSFWDDALRPSYDYGQGDDPDGGQGSGPDTFRRTGVTDTSPPAGLIPAGASGRGLHTYLISASNYGDLQNYLWGDASTLAKSLWQKFQNKTHSPVSCIVAVYTLPADFMPTAGIATNIRIAGVTLPISVYSADLGFAVHSFEFAPIDKPFHNFADFSHVTCKLYVPFCGEIPIPVEAAYNRTVGVRYWVDQFNGNLVARVYCGDINIGELSSNVAYRIPIVGGDDGSLDRIGAAMTGIAQITAGNYAGALGSLAEELTAPYVTQLVNADFSGSMSACTFRRPYIEWTANNDYYSNEFFKTRGVPARYGATLSSFSGGYLECETKVQSVDIPSATDSERQEIENLLRGGIYA